ncbi:DUF389 domain-containing protein [Methanobrevibacter millerae]|jgi:uncharacterized hydrophobic protein (TIGR00271 family)|uniref:TIGR00341 family protein n=1 Tax=Methanobrevibacter millerae TaxID=230361 RepID=A0A0U3E6P5_9EURY|nr:DUF389 domain-containing protein [Methanobrevibacter millerae]ALT67944.1 hypothetical protein sm9_0135 [Methanobrevibacter millerae]MBO6110966.1 DUF389 domain-containing protein [Methanobrevibacter sp.]
MSLKEQNETMKEKVRKAFSLSEDSASHEEIRERLLDGGKITGTNMCVMVCAMIIASVGLNMNSTAVIIGAMLISPIMGSILASAYGNVSADYSLLRNHLIGLGMQVGISVAAATIYFFLSPVKEPTVELLARTSPSFYDVLIAFFGGLAGIIGQTRIDKTNTVIPGVAIATALMPPLCTCGYAIANGRLDMLLGAGYLFILNAYFIFLSASMILTILKIPKTKELTEKEWRRHRFRMVRNTILIAIPSIVAVYFMVH